MARLVKFAELPEDILRNVLEYVPILDRIRFEAVHSFWEDVVEVMFKSQKSLAITNRFPMRGWMPGREYYCTCLEHKHKFYEIDVVFTHSRDILLNLVKRCPCLKQLYFKTESSCGYELGTTLSQCPGLVLDWPIHQTGSRWL